MKIDSLVTFPEEITSFRGDYYFLSNFYPCKVTMWGYTYKNAEAAFQAAKCAEPTERKRFQYMNAYTAKKEGKSVVLRSGWETAKYAVMYEVLRQKFTENPELKQKLLATENRRLVEGNTYHDNEWGDCFCSACRNKKGQNHLGILLMQLRDVLADIVQAMQS